MIPAAKRHCFCTVRPKLPSLSRTFLALGPPEQEWRLHFHAPWQDISCTVNSFLFSTMPNCEEPSSPTYKPIFELKQVGFVISPTSPCLEAVDRRLLSTFEFLNDLVLTTDSSLVKLRGYDILVKLNCGSSVSRFFLFNSHKLVWSGEWKMVREEVLLVFF